MFAFDASFWRDRRVFVTGHTGFKGAWLVLWLRRLGARVTGLALPPNTDPSLFALCARGQCTDIYGDIADYTLLARALADCEPEIAIHMAAQALVRPSYTDPLGTYATNVMGTANVLQAVRSVASVRAVIVVTSDKVYENDGGGRPFTEDDRLGGRDPYSSSKACAELVTDSFRQCFFGDSCRVATVRAGNVIGGGDWSPFRIAHDLVKAFEAGEAGLASLPPSGSAMAARARSARRLSDAGASHGHRSRAHVKCAEFCPGGGQFPLGVRPSPGLHHPMGRPSRLAVRQRRASARSVFSHPRRHAR